MAFRTLNEIVQGTIIELAQAPGTSTQIYSEDIIAEYIQSAFDYHFEEFWLDDYMTWITSTLDSSFGSPQADISGIKKFSDVRNIFPDGSDTPLRLLPITNINPFNMTSGDAQYAASDSSVTDKIIRIYPNTSSNTIHINARLEPDKFISTSTIKLDYLLLKYHASWQLAVSDDINASEMNKFKSLYDTILATWSANKLNLPIDLNPNRESINSQWR